MIDLLICVGRRPMAVDSNCFDSIDAITLEHILSDFSSQPSHNTAKNPKITSKPWPIRPRFLFGSISQSALLNKFPPHIIMTRKPFPNYWIGSISIAPIIMRRFKLRRAWSTSRSGQCLTYLAILSPPQSQPTPRGSNFMKISSPYTSARVPMLNLTLLNTLVPYWGRGAI